VRRSKPLRADPDKTRRWQDRSRDAAVKREGIRWVSLRRSTPGFITSGFQATNPKARGRRSRVPGLRGFTQRVFALYGDRCVVCHGKAVQAHHVVPLRTLFARGEDYALEAGGDARNGAPICVACHESHENASRRIRRSELPVGVIRWAQQEDFGWYIDRPGIYPP
jgi:hypothetical protein